MVEGDKKENKLPEEKLERLAEHNHQNGSCRTDYIFVETSAIQQGIFED